MHRKCHAQRRGEHAEQSIGIQVWIVMNVGLEKIFALTPLIIYLAGVQPRIAAASWKQSKVIQEKQVALILINQDQMGCST